jgi:hypothetical protein
MRKLPKRNPNIYGFGSAGRYDIEGLKKKLQITCDKELEKFNKKAVTQFRKSVRWALENDPHLYGFAPLADKIKVDNRPFGHPKVGSGLSFRIDNDKLNVRLVLFDRAMYDILGRDGFYKLKTYTEGKYRFIVNPQKTTPIRVQNDDHRALDGYEYYSREYDNKLEENDDPPTGVFFIFSKKKIDRTMNIGFKSNWGTKAITHTIDEMKRQAKKR